MSQSKYEFKTEIYSGLLLGENSMRSILFSFYTITISILGFIIFPMFIIGVDLRSIPVVDVTPQAIEARKNINRMNEEGTIESAVDVEKWWRDINSQPRKEYTDKALYQIAQKNFLWFSWIPVFFMFYFISKNKKKDLIYFVCVSSLACTLGILVLSTLFTYVVAGFLGLLLSEVRARRRSKKDPE